MVAYDSRRHSDPARSLSPETIARLREALLVQWRAPGAPHPVLGEALGAAAREARERSLRPEELIIALKAIEEQMAEHEQAPAEAARRKVHDWIVRACVKAYFGGEGS